MKYCYKKKKISFSDCLFQNTQAEWRNVFYVCAAFDVLGIIVFGLFASGEMQGWARDPRDDIEITIPRSAKTSISESDKCSEKEVDEKMHSDSDNVVKEETDLSAERKGS